MFAAKRDQQFHHVRRRLRIEVARRLIGEQQRWRRDQSARDGRTLLFACRQPNDGVCAAVAQPDPCEQPPGSLLSFPPRPPRDEQRQRDVLQRCQIGQQAVCLKDERKALSSPPRERRLVGARDIEAMKDDLASVGLFDSGDQVKQGRLSSPGSPHNGNDLALIHEEARTSQHVNRTLHRMAKAFAQVAHDERCATVLDRFNPIRDPFRFR